MRKKEETRKLFKEKLFLMKINIKKRNSENGRWKRGIERKREEKMDKQNRKL